MTLTAGRWKMRNGKIAIVKKLLEIPYVEQATGKPKKYPVWLGQCECCKSSMSWNANGTHAPIGRHPFDIIGAAK